jgi:hypothetical protein
MGVDCFLVIRIIQTGLTANRGNNHHDNQKDDGHDFPATLRQDTHLGWIHFWLDSV